MSQPRSGIAEAVIWANAQLIISWDQLLFVDEREWSFADRGADRLRRDFGHHAPSRWRLVGPYRSQSGNVRFDGDHGLGMSRVVPLAAN